MRIDWFPSDLHTHAIVLTHPCSDIHMNVHTKTHIHKDKNFSLFKVPVLSKSNSHRLIKCSCCKAIKALVIWDYKDTEYDHKTNFCSLLGSKKCLNSDLVKKWTDKLKMSPSHRLSESCFPLRVLREEMNLHCLSEATILFSADWTWA